MKAYIITDPEWGACIKFAEHAVVARREGSAEIGVEFCEVTCRRAPEFDSYSEEGRVPKKILIDHGWRFECHGCGMLVYGEVEDDEGNVLELYFPNDHSVYCSLQCCSEEVERKNEEKRREKQVVNAAQAKWPGIEIIYSNGYMDPQHVQFKFPGGAHNVDWRMGQGFVIVSKVDVEKWKKFAESVKKNDH